MTSLRNLRCRATTFYVLWWFILAVSVWDGYLTIVWRDQLIELNPIGQLLIRLDNGQVRFLILAKLVGTLLAGAWLCLLFERNSARATIIAGVVAGVQLLLLLYLTFK